MPSQRYFYAGLSPLRPKTQRPRDAPSARIIRINMSWINMTKSASINGPYSLVARRVGTTADNPECDYSTLPKSVAFMRVLRGFTYLQGL